MKYGVRKPNISKSVKARTTGKVKRQVKKSVNPLYGKNGKGVISDPKKAAYNAVYNRTTVGVSDILQPETENFENSKSSSSAGGVFRGIGSFFQFLFALLQLAFWLACIIGIIALVVWIFKVF